MRLSLPVRFRAQIQVSHASPFMDSKGRIVTDVHVVETGSLELDGIRVSNVDECQTLRLLNGTSRFAKFGCTSVSSCSVFRFFESP